MDCFPQVIITVVLQESQTRIPMKTGCRTCRTKDEPIRSGTRTQTSTNQVTPSFPFIKRSCF